MKKTTSSSKLSLKITIFLPTLNGGGAERVMVTLANAIAYRGFHVDLVLSTAKGPYLKEVSPAVRVVDLHSGRVIKALLPLVRYLRRERPLAMLSVMRHANVVALLARKLARVPLRLVVSERGFISSEYALARGMVEHFNFFLARWFYPVADDICVVSKVAAKDLASFLCLPLDRVQTVYNPFDLDHIMQRSIQPLGHPWLLSDRVPLILAVGRLNEAKDFSVLISAFAKLRESRAARLIILGEGELRSELETQITQFGLNAEIVQLPGFVDNPYAWLARCSLFVLSSRREGLPGALIEAMACGAPVVSTNCLSGPDEILEGGRWGRLVPVGDVDALAHAMAETLDIPLAQRPKVRLRAANFEQERSVDAYLRILGMPLYAVASLAR